AGDLDIRDRYYENEAIKDDRNIYLKATHEVAKRIYLFGDVQYRTINYTFDGVNDDQRIVTGEEHYQFFNPKFGLSIESENGKIWYASYAVANREPVRDDFIDNPLTELPKPEKLQNIEAGIRSKKGNFSYNGNFYYMDYKDHLILTGQINNVGAYIRDNVPNSYRAGLELAGAVDFSSQWSISGNLSLSRNKIERFTEFVDDYSADGAPQDSFVYENTDIAFSPSIIGSSIVNFRPVQDLEISLMSKYVGEQYLDNSQKEDRK